MGGPATAPGIVMFVGAAVRSGMASANPDGLLGTEDCRSHSAVQEIWIEILHIVDLGE